MGNPDELISLKKTLDKADKKSSSTSKLMYAFVAPEMSADPSDISGYENKSSWDVAMRFQDLKRFGHIPDKEKYILKRRAVEGVLDRAHQILGAVIKREKQVLLNHTDFLQSGAKGDLDVLATVEESLFHSHNTLVDALRYEARVEKNPDIQLLMDASLSMTGEKIALLAVAVAVVSLCIPSKNLSLMGFDSKITWIKKFSQNLNIIQIIERVLELPTGGFTNLELALENSSQNLRISNKTNSNVILISDGKYTEGSDPVFLGNRFKKLNVLKIGRDQAGRLLLEELTLRGNGRFFEAKKLSELPKVMYSAIRQLI